jgi:hypothetical protein
MSTTVKVRRNRDNQIAIISQATAKVGASGAIERAQGSRCLPDLARLT